MECFTSVGAYGDGKKCIENLEFAFGFDLKMKIAPGIIIETKDVENGNLNPCYLFGKKLVQELVMI